MSFFITKINSVIVDIHCTMVVDQHFQVKKLVIPFAFLKDFTELTIKTFVHL